VTRGSCATVARPLACGTHGAAIDDWLGGFIACWRRCSRGLKFVVGPLPIYAGPAIRSGTTPTTAATAAAAL
jgi:hypothetical protein